MEQIVLFLLLLSQLSFANCLKKLELINDWGLMRHKSMPKGHKRIASITGLDVQINQTGTRLYEAIIIKNNEVVTKVNIKFARDAYDPNEKGVEALRLNLLPIPVLKLLDTVIVKKPTTAYNGYVLGQEPKIIKLSSLAPIATIYHESGHVLHRHTKMFKKRWKEAVIKDNKTLTRYAKVNLNEDFAESFVAFLEPDKELKSKYQSLIPHRFKLIEEFLNESHSMYNSQLLDQYMRIGLVISVLAGGPTGAAYLFFYFTEDDDESYDQETGAYSFQDSSS